MLISANHNELKPLIQNCSLCPALELPCDLYPRVAHEWHRRTNIRGMTTALLSEMVFYQCTKSPKNKGCFGGWD